MYRMRHPNGTAQLVDQAQRHFNISIKSREAQPNEEPDAE